MAARTSRSRAPRAAEFTTPLTIPGGAVAGAEVVRELAPEVSLTVWQALRSVLMWAAEEPASRGDLFEPCAMADWERELLEAEWDDELRCPLAVVVGELREPARASSESLARACLCVADWAITHGAVGTALCFAEAAALAWPDHPRYAWTAGRMLRTHGRLREAEQWFKRASRIASPIGDWEGHALAVNSLGNLLYEAGNYPAAIRTLKDAVRLARKHHLRQLEGEILHDLFAVTMWSGDHDQAEEIAKATLEIYQTGHPRLAALAHDVAALWIRRGSFNRALAVLKELPGFIEAPEERVRVLASLAHAAGACGDAESFAEAAATVKTMSADEGIARHAAPALLEVALGAWSLGESAAAVEWLEEAVSLGRRSGEADVQLTAESALNAVRAGLTPEGHAVAVESRRAVSDSLVNGFLTSLQISQRPGVAA